ncbi:MAG TPA: hypothetical protein VF317_01295, partial [Dermatophilaceae bacterium]
MPRRYRDDCLTADLPERDTGHSKDRRRGAGGQVPQPHRPNSGSSGEHVGERLLVRADGSVVVVDWPWASRGHAWLDILLVLINVCVCGEGDVDALLSAHTSPDVDPNDLTAVLAGLAG